MKGLRRLVNLIGGETKKPGQGAFLVDAYRRRCLLSESTHTSTYGLVNRDTKNSHYVDHGRLVVKEGQLRDDYSLSGDVQSHLTGYDNFIESCLAIQNFKGFGDWEENHIICHVTGHQAEDGTVRFNRKKHTNDLIKSARKDQKILLIMDTCNGPEWFKNLSPNFCCIGTGYTSGISTVERIECGDAAMGTLLQWAIDQSLRRANDKPTEWRRELLSIWSDLKWVGNATLVKPEYKKLEFSANFQDIGNSEWDELLPQFYSKRMETSPLTAEIDESHMYEWDIYAAVGCEDWEEVYKLGMDLKDSNQLDEDEVWHLAGKINEVFDEIPLARCIGFARVALHRNKVEQLFPHFMKRN